MYLTFPYSGGTPINSYILLYGEGVVSYKITDDIVVSIQRHFGLYSSVVFSDTNGNFLELSDDIKIINNTLNTPIKAFPGKNLYVIDWYIGEYSVFFKENPVLILTPELSYVLKKSDIHLV